MVFFSRYFEIEQIIIKKKGNFFLFNTQMAMNINFNRQKLIFVFLYFSRNKISFFPFTPTSNLKW
jgi:hypothetical protein